MTHLNEDVKSLSVSGPPDHEQMTKDAKEADPSFFELSAGYSHDGEWVDMGTPRECSYNFAIGRDASFRRKVRIGKSIAKTKSSYGSSDLSPMPVELRGITPRQLRAIYANGKRRCIEENWTTRKGEKVTPDSLDLYDINKYIIIPFTKSSKGSLVETLPSTAGSQDPRWFVSHWWGESFSRTMACIETMVIDFKTSRTSKIYQDDTRGGGGMTEDTPIWICAFANNQHDLEGDGGITSNPKDSGFAKAMKVANFRTISILDENSIVFTRIWCIFELYSTLHSDEALITTDSLWAVYTAHKHIGGRCGKEERDAVGIIAGGCTCDRGSPTCIASRERHFPTQRILKSIDIISVENAEATEKRDRNNILNAIISDTSNLDADPPSSHAKYDDLNATIRAAFASSIAALRAALSKGDQEFHKMFTAMSKGTQRGHMAFNFKKGGKLPWDSLAPEKAKSLNGKSFLDSLAPERAKSLIGKSSWDSLTPEKAKSLISHAPVTREGLTIYEAYDRFNTQMTYGIIEWVEKTVNLKHLKVRESTLKSDNDDDAGARLAEALVSNCSNSIEYICLHDATDLVTSRNILKWEEALKILTNLKQLFFIGTSISDEEKERLKAATHAKDIIISDAIFLWNSKDAHVTHDGARHRRGVPGSRSTWLTLIT